MGPCQGVLVNLSTQNCISKNTFGTTTLFTRLYVAKQNLSDPACQTLLKFEGIELLTQALP